MALFDSVFAQMFEENQLFGGGEGNTLDSKNLVASTHIKREKASLPVDVRRRGVGDSAYERGWDARRLAQGCKFRILVSLRVFWAKSHHI